jgi:hypothetical protein
MDKPKFRQFYKMYVGLGKDSAWFMEYSINNNYSFKCP